EVPYKRGPFQPPDVPDAVISDVIGLIEGERALLQSSRLFETLLRLILIGDAVRLDEIIEQLFELTKLIRGEFRHTNAWELAIGALELHFRFIRRFFHKR